MGDAFSYIREGLPESNRPGREGWGKDEDGHLLAGVVGAAPGGVVAVVGGEDEKVVGPELRDELREPIIELLQGVGIAWNVAAMS